jgi:hypothetical protein
MPSNEERIFVVMQEGAGSSVCCLMQPYSQIYPRNRCGNNNCAVIFEVDKSPQLFLGESGVDRFPVRIEKPAETIDPTLRLNFSSVYMIEHSAKVRNVGRIDRDYLKALKSTFSEAEGEINSGNTKVEEDQEEEDQMDTYPLLEKNLEDAQEEMKPTTENILEEFQADINYVASKSWERGDGDHDYSRQSQHLQHTQVMALPTTGNDTSTETKKRMIKSLHSGNVSHRNRYFNY